MTAYDRRKRNCLIIALSGFGIAIWAGIEMYQMIAPYYF